MARFSSWFVVIVTILVLRGSDGRAIDDEKLPVSSDEGRELSDHPKEEKVAVNSLNSTSESGRKQVGGTLEDDRRLGRRAAPFFGMDQIIASTLRYFWGTFQSSVFSPFVRSIQSISSLFGFDRLINSVAQKRMFDVDQGEFDWQESAEVLFEVLKQYTREN